RYLPNISWEQHQTIYRKWKNYHLERPLSTLVETRIVPAKLSKAFQSPCIINLFHLSDHLVWPVLLAKNGVRFNVLLDRTVYVNAKVVLNQLLQELSAYGHTPELLFSDDKALLLKIRSRKACGQHLLCFADGASGASSSKKDERIPITFFEGTLWLKKGIPFISHLFEMPVVSLLPHTVGNMQQLEVNKTVSPAPNEFREVYMQRCLHELYDRLEKNIKKSPYLWECWGYLHQNGVLGEISDNQYVDGLGADVQIFWQDKMIVFDRLNYAVKME